MLRIVRFSTRCILPVLLAVLPVYAGVDDAGLSGAVFLKIPTGGRIVAMGEAYTAVADDPYAIAANPAGISRTRNLEIAFSHTRWFQDVGLEYLGFSKSFFRGFGGANSTAAASVHYLHVPEFPSYDDWAGLIGPVGYAGWAVSAAYAQEMPSFPLRAGVGIRAVGETRDNVADAAATMNIGLQYSWHLPVLRIFKLVLRDRVLETGFTMDNWSMGMKVGGAGTPLVWKAGLAFRAVDELLTAVDLQFPMDGRMRMNLGAEYAYREFLFVRAGYRFWGVDTDGLSLGLGSIIRLSGKQIKADFSWAPQAALGHTFVLSLSMRYPGRLTDEQERMRDLLYYRGIYFYTRGEIDKAVETWKECLKLDPDFAMARKKLDEAYRLIKLRGIEEALEKRQTEETK